MVIARLFLLAAGVAAAAGLEVPALRGVLTVDGRLDEPLWQKAYRVVLTSPEFGAPFPAGGEARIGVCGNYLCLAASLPEPDRVAAISVNRNPTWWREDQMVWTFAVHLNGRNRRLTLTANPLGAYSLESTVSDPAVSENELAAARVANGAWTMEAAIPLSRLATIGLVSAERIRAPRPDAPELRWHWPGANERAGFELPAAAPHAAVAPLFQPARLPAPEPEPRRAYSGLAAELAESSGLVWNDSERARLDDVLHSNLRARMREAALAERREWEKVASRADWERFRNQRIAALRDSLGPFPERTPLRAAVTRRADYGDGFVVENMIYESRPGRLVAANLYLPAKVAGRIPAVVVVHSHHAPKTQAELQDMGMTWARAGAAVLVPDQAGAGERVESQPWPRESYYSRYAMATQLYLAGESLMQWMVWDLVRAIDQLFGRPDIDPKRIVMLGAVAGGGDPAAVTAALDERIAVSIPFNFGEAGPEEHYTEGPRPYDFETADPGWGSWESTRNLHRSASGQFFPWLICASVAPRPFLFSFEIAWPKTVEEEPAWARYKKVFGLYGRRGRLASVDGFGPFPGPGECTNVGSFLRQRIYPVLKQWLDMPAPAYEYRNLRPDSELMCLTPKVAAERKPRTTAALAAELARTRLDAARGNRAPLRQSLAAKLGSVEPVSSAPARIMTVKILPRYTRESFLIEAEPGITLPGILLRPPGGAPPPVVLAFALEGKSGFLAHRAPEIASLLEAGVAVCLADVRGAGELTRRAARSPGGMSNAATELMLGNTLLGARVKDARTVFRYLSGRADLDKQRIALWGDSFAAVNPRDMLFDKSLHQPAGPHVAQAEPMGPLVALLAALYEPGVVAVAVRRGLASFLSVLEDRFAYVPLDVVVPGMLVCGDLRDIATAISPRPLLIQAAVDGRNRQLTLAELKTQAAPRPNVTIREEADPAFAAAWLRARLRNSAGVRAASRHGPRRVRSTLGPSPPCAP